MGRARIHAQAVCLHVSPFTLKRWPLPCVWGGGGRGTCTRQPGLCVPHLCLPQPVACSTSCGFPGRTRRRPRVPWGRSALPPSQGLEQGQPLLGGPEEARYLASHLPACLQEENRIPPPVKPSMSAGGEEEKIWATVEAPLPLLLATFTSRLSACHLRVLQGGREGAEKANGGLSASVSSPGKVEPRQTESSGSLGQGPRLPPGHVGRGLGTLWVQGMSLASKRRTRNKQTGRRAAGSRRDGPHNKAVPSRLWRQG